MSSVEMRDVRLQSILELLINRNQLYLVFQCLERNGQSNIQYIWLHLADWCLFASNRVLALQNSI